MLGKILGALGGSVVGSIERIALEVIDTDKESAEAKALMVKTLAPNGKMRRDLSRFASYAYGFYLVCTTVLIFMHNFGMGEPANSGAAIEAMTDLFLPITGSWGAIVTASFGVNGVNAHKGEK